MCIVIAGTVAAVVVGCHRGGGAAAAVDVAHLVAAIGVPFL